MGIIIGAVCVLMGLAIGFLMGSRFFSKNRSLEAIQFENLAGKIFQQNVHQFQESSEKNISQILNPLKERLLEFQKQVEETYSKESRDRFALQKEIERIVAVNLQMSEKTDNLTRALRGDVKVQGSWGEMVLERILEASGLRAGEEYTVQGKDLGLKSMEGQRLRPDVIVNLPENKHVIVDAKVSLTHYDRTLRAENENDRSVFLKQFLNSIYAHLDGLSTKGYQDLEKLETPDFVLMFIPIEGAFSLAVQSDPELFTYAWNKLVVLVSPTTLLVTLRTIASLWKQERQNRHALEIARQGGLLYDKFVGFLGDLEKVGESLTRSQDSFAQAMSKLQYGKGNLISKVENLKELGAKTSKSIPQEYLLDQELVEAEIKQIN